MSIGSSEPPLLDPFALTPNPAVYVPRAATEAVRTELLESVRNPATRTALIGPPGLGKTLMLQLLAAQVRDEFRPIYLPYAALPPEELCAWALSVLGAPAASDPIASLRALAARQREEPSPLLLSIDDAGAMPVATARWVGDLVSGSEGALRLLISASDQDSTNRALAAIGGDFDIVALSEPMSEAETRSYIDARLTLARVPLSMRQRFDAETVRRLHQTSAGIPRRLHTAAAALLHGGRRPRWIDLDPVLEELGEIGRGARPRAQMPTESSEATLEAPRGSTGVSRPTPPPPSADAGGEAAPTSPDEQVRAPTLPSRPLRRIEPLPSSVRLALGALLIAGLTIAIPVIRSLLPRAVRPAAIAGAAPIEAPASGSGSAEPVAGEAAVPAPRAEPAPLAAAAGAVGPFPVHVNATPWANVFVDGIELGATPIANIPLLAGTHTFTARMSDGRVIERVVEIDADNRFVGFE